MPAIYFTILELILFFVFIPLIFNALNALDLSQIFRKGHSKHIQILYISLTIILAFLLAEAITRVLEMSSTLFN